MQVNEVPGTTVDDMSIDSEGVEEIETDDSIKEKVKNTLKN